MIERPAAGERAVIVQLDFGQPDIEDQLEEVRLLAESAGGVVAAEVFGRRQSPDPKTYAGKGKVDEIGAMVAAGEADLVIFNHDLSPAQQRNLERLLKCRVIDRTSLILDIFALRASSAEGKLQVELAQLEHLSTRLVRGWTHLERQRGGIGITQHAGGREVGLDEVVAVGIMQQKRVARLLKQAPEPRFTFRK